MVKYKGKNRLEKPDTNKQQLSHIHNICITSSKMILLCALFFKLLALTTAHPNPQKDLDIIEDEIFADKHYKIEPTENCDAFIEPDSIAIENTKVRLLRFKSWLYSKIGIHNIEVIDLN